MNTYEAMVHIASNNMYVKTRVQAQSTQDALWLLQGQYGPDSVVIMPTLIG